MSSESPPCSVCLKLPHDPMCPEGGSDWKMEQCGLCLGEGQHESESICKNCVDAGADCMVECSRCGGSGECHPSQNTETRYGETDG